MAAEYGREHVFQGRNKAVPVSVAAEIPYNFLTVAGYIHLSPARAGRAGGSKGKLTAYKWSSSPNCARGRRTYVAWLE